jgi:hypothetical protein
MQNNQFNSMNLAIMQPYIFPYIGYFQLIHNSDRFVFYDDVNFIKGGWINRNKILVGNKEFLFTIPLKGASSFKHISETLVHPILFNRYKVKLLRTIELAYVKAPYYDNFFPLLKDFILNYSNSTISDLAIESIMFICDYLVMNYNFERSSDLHIATNYLNGKDRVIEICKRENAASYINTIGGLNLYTKSEFEQNEITLNFLKSGEIKYQQFENEFVPSLSIIDVLMFNSKERVNQMLQNYELI